MVKRIIVPVVFIIFSYVFWMSYEFKEIAAGIAIFLLGIFFLEEGFKAFSREIFEKAFKASKNNIFKSIGFGCIITMIMQSSSLVSVLSISFLGTGLIELGQAIGTILGANIGTTSSTWLIAGFGLKVNISSYALPMLVFGILFIFQHSNLIKEVGYILTGFGFLLLGMHYVREGFESFKDVVDLYSIQINGLKGIVAFVGIGIVLTMIIQSSYVSILLIIVALSVGIVSYQNALILTIGANIGTAIVAIVGSIRSNTDGKRLAGVHFIFYILTGIIAIFVMNPMMDIVDIISSAFRIPINDYIFKLAVFDTLFKIMGLFLLLPFMNVIQIFLITLFKDKRIKQTKNHEKVFYLSTAVLELSSTSLVAIAKETKHLYTIAFKILSNGFLLKQRNVLSDMQLDDVINDEYTKEEVDVSREYLLRVKDISGAILDFATRAQINMEEDDIKKMYELKLANRAIVTAIKDTQQLCQNIKIYTKAKNPYVTNEYNLIRKNMIALLRTIDLISKEDDQGVKHELIIKAKDQAKTNDLFANGALDKLIRRGLIPNDIVISLMEDSAYAYGICQHLINMAQILFVNHYDKHFLNYQEAMERVQK